MTFNVPAGRFWDFYRPTRRTGPAKLTAFGRIFSAYSSGSNSNSPLNVPQRAAAIGDPVPIVFARRRNNAGGILISPGATECRFENNAGNDVTAFYHLVLSEGRIGAIQVRDVFQRQCRVGSFQQTYDRRAGSWIPENAIVPRSGKVKPEASNYCGSVGAYRGMSTMSFQVEVPDGLDVWNRQVHCFIRQGIQVYRWADSQEDVSSDSFADLAYWLMINSARIPEGLINTDSIRDASKFLNVNKITTNCWITSPINYDELLITWGRYHLLRPVTNKGKAGFKALLPLNNDFSIKTSSVSVEFTFDDSLIISDSIEIQYVDWASRQPFVCQVVWRQQNEADTGAIRTAEVRYANTAANGPYESHNLSEFCTREDHAVKVGAYILSKRVRSNHSINFTARPGAHSSIVEQGSIIRVRFRRESEDSSLIMHDRIYEVERVRRALSGEVEYEATHLPVDDQLRSLIALDVMNAPVSGVIFPTNTTGEGCDLNSITDDTEPDDPEEETIIPDEDEPASEGGDPVELPQGDNEIDLPDPEDLSDAVAESEFDDFVRGLNDEDLVFIIDDLLSDLADEFRDLDDSDLADLVRDLLESELPDDELAELVRDLPDDELIELLSDVVKDIITEDLDLGFPSEFVDDLILKFRNAFEDEIEEPVTDPLAEYQAGIYFHSATWDELDLTIAMRLAPTGRAPREDLGALDVTIGSTSVVALLPNGTLADPQPESLPSVSFTGQIAEPWDATTEGLPVPPSDRVFEGQFVITFTEGDFPPAAENPAEQLTYRAIVEFTDWEGGFTDVSFLNTLTVDFEGAAVEPEVNELVIYYPDEPPPLATVEGVTITDFEGGPYGTTAFQDVNALQAPNTNNYLGPYWELSNIDNAVDVGSEPFTLEFWWRLGTSLPTNGNFSAYVSFSFGFINAGQPGIFTILQYEGQEAPLNVSPNIRIVGGTGTESIEATEDTISSGDATSFNHLAIQRHNATNYTIHYKGAVLRSWTMASFSYSSLPIEIQPAALNVPGAALSQIRITKSARYGTGTFTPPSTAFFTPPS